MINGIRFPSEAHDVGKVGGKAAALSRLASQGFDVPDFFVVEPAAVSELSCVGLSDAVSRLGDGPFAVRSSGCEEDGASHPHAGQFLSILSVPREKVADAVARVQRSGETETLRAYRTSRGLAPGGGSPAVIVQRMVPARAAGVAFSADPVSGRRDRIVISATQGLGDRLVGGEVDGDQYVVDAATGRVVERPQGSAVLSESDVAAIAMLARRVEASAGTPQDIEWAFDGDRLRLLQARAITTSLRAPVVADPTITIFDNSNIVESYPGHVSPLTFSFAQYAYARVYRAFLQLCGVDENEIRRNAFALENMLGRLDGRVYYNLGNWYRLLALMPGFRLNRAHMETMMGVGEPLPREIADALAPPSATGLAKAGEWARLARMAATLAFEALRLRKTIRNFYGRLDAALATDAASIDTMSLSQLAAYYRRMEAELLDRWDAPLVNDFLCMIAFGGSRKLAERWLGEPGLALHNDVMIGQGDIVSAEPPRRIMRMGRLIAGDDALIDALARGDAAAVRLSPELKSEFESYLAKFSDRCAEELKLESITLNENPRPLLAPIAAAARQTSKPSVRDTEGIAALDRLLAGRPVKRFVLARVLGWAKDRVRDRENLRFERTRIFGRARRVFLAIGSQLHASGRLDHPRDVFLLTVPEILGAIEGFGLGGDLAGIVDRRRAAAAVEAAKPDPGERVTVKGAIVLRDGGVAVQPGPRVEASGAMQGTGCSAGVVTAKARVVRDPSTEMLGHGEVLVAKHTDPGWIALFSNASAIVVERGSLLSHSAIVARELGIPCVVGLKGAMSLIATGDTIEVDGASGHVRKVA